MEKILEKPKTLYRGVTLPALMVGPELATQELLPGSTPKIDEQGRATVNDGNEYGVYMSDNEHMVDVAYSSPRHGDNMPDSPTFNRRGIPGERVQQPRVGVTYEIDTDGLEVRQPFITGYLQGVYNNGFKGSEWIADSVPASNHRIKRLTVGTDTLHGPKSIEVGDNPEEAFEELRLELDRRMGRLAIACELISALPDASRRNEFRIKDILRGIPD